jgi:TolA-binding protein
MKRSERHHLKENELAHSLDRVREQFEGHKNQVVGVAILIAVIVVAVAGYVWYRQHIEGTSRALLASAMAIEQAQVTPPTPPAAAAAGQPVPPPAPLGSFASEQAKLTVALPRFMEAAETYPSTSSGIAARYQAAACLLRLGRPTEAIDRYREVIERDGKGLYGEMARMGLGEAQIVAGQYDAAITSYREMVSGSSMPTDAVLMQLGRACAKAGKKTEAEQAFKRIMDEFPQSQYAQAAKQELDAVKTPAA